MTQKKLNQSQKSQTVNSKTGGGDISGSTENQRQASDFGAGQMNGTSLEDDQEAVMQARDRERSLVRRE